MITWVRRIMIGVAIGSATGCAATGDDRSTSLDIANVEGRQTQYFEHEKGRLAYHVRGEGPLVVMVPGIGDLRHSYRFVEPILVEAGYRVASMDLRGLGETSSDWAEYGAEATARDMVALLDHLGAESAVIVGTSMAAASATAVAADHPERVDGTILIGPFLRDAELTGFQRILYRVALSPPWGVAVWLNHMDDLYPAEKPADYSAYRTALSQNLRESGRFNAMRTMLLDDSKHSIEQRLHDVAAPALVLMGTRDPDFSDPHAEAEWAADAVGARVVMIEDAGHYPHAERPAPSAEAILAFMEAIAPSDRSARRADRS